MEMQDNLSRAHAILERAFNQGDLSVIDLVVAQDGVDHQEPPGTEIRPHLKAVVTGLRTAFPDLHFEINDSLSNDDTVAFRTTMTGTHKGLLKLGPGPGVPPTGRAISVAHMYFLRFVDGQNTDLWHVWDLAGLMRQLQASAEAKSPQPA